jgi:hypothetical protein
MKKQKTLLYSKNKILLNEHMMNRLNKVFLIYLSNLLVLIVIGSNIDLNDTNTVDIHRQSFATTLATLFWCK